MADIFGGKVIEIQVFTCEVSKYMFLGSVNMNMRFRKRIDEVTINKEATYLFSHMAAKFKVAAILLFTN